MRCAPPSAPVARRSAAAVRAQEGWQTASTSVDDWVHEYPLAAGAIAVAVGAAIGLSVPSTEIEDRTLGEKRDQALEKARSAAREIRENVTQKVQDVAETVMDVTGTAATGPSRKDVCNEPLYDAGRTSEAAPDVAPGGVGALYAGCCIMSVPRIRDEDGAHGG